MRRLLWLGVGLAVGALAVRAVSARPAGVNCFAFLVTARKSAGGLAGGVRSFIDDVRDGMYEREAQIEAAFVDGEAIGDPDSLGEFYVEGNYR
jgi:hypothetical protein